MTDYDDFKSLGGTSAVPRPQPTNATHNVLTVGYRSDGQVAILSSPNTSGPTETVSLIMPRDTARWLAKEILRVTDVGSHSGSAPK